MPTESEELPDIYRMLLEFDGADPRSREVYEPGRLKYLSRLEAVVSPIREAYPDPSGVRVGDFGCGAGTISYIIARLGYEVLAVDIDEKLMGALEAKCRDLAIDWRVSNIEDLRPADESVDVAVAVELVEHCAHPEDIVQKLYEFVKPGGLLIITTPNGSRLGSRLLLSLPSYTKVIGMADRSSLEETQFGTDEHVLRFKLKELEYLVPEGGRLIRSGYSGVSAVLFNKITFYLMRAFPINRVLSFNTLLPRVPIVNTLAASKVYAVIQKNS